MNGTLICDQLGDLYDKGADLEKLLVSAVDLIHEANPRFHWTGIYELFPDNVLRLGPFIGAPTDHVFITVGNGVCGSAIAEKRNKNIPDVSKEPNYLACSAFTKSELVILIRKGGTIFAQIDIDSHDIDAFDVETSEEVQKIADWLADAYQQNLQSNGMKSGRGK
ncbi:MAG: GAF domain-containing protein [bacterium]|nr:GAF domain-containing protein [bacterium]